MAAIPNNSPFILTKAKDKDGNDAQRVLIGAQDPIPVDPTTRGEAKSIYNEVTVPGLATVEIINKTIGAGLGADLVIANCSGENVADFTVQVNGSDAFKKRTYYTYFNVDFKMEELPLQDGDNIKIIVENRTNSTAVFNATLIYNEFSA